MRTLIVALLLASAAIAQPFESGRIYNSGHLSFRIDESPSGVFSSLQVKAPCTAAEVMVVIYYSAYIEGIGITQQSRIVTARIASCFWSYVGAIDIPTTRITGILIHGYTSVVVADTWH